ncbi:MAG: hypothetical protein MHPSP_004153, partial [Paramarteilia canceri]
MNDMKTISKISNIFEELDIAYMIEKNIRNIIHFFIDENNIEFIMDDNQKWLEVLIYLSRITQLQNRYKYEINKVLRNFDSVDLIRIKDEIISKEAIVECLTSIICWLNDY